MKVKKCQNPHQPIEDKQPEWNLFSLFLHKQQQSAFGDYPINKINKSIDCALKVAQNNNIPIKKCKKNNLPKSKQIATSSGNNSNKQCEDGEQQHQLKPKHERHNSSYRETSKVSASSLLNVQTEENSSRNKSALNFDERINLTRNSSEVFPPTKIKENASIQSNKIKKSNGNKSQILLHKDQDIPTSNRQKRAYSSEAVKRPYKYPSPKKTTIHGAILTNNSSRSSLIPQVAYGQYSSASCLSVKGNQGISRKNSQICSESSLKLNYAVESNLTSRQQSKRQIRSEFEEHRQSSHSQRRSNLPTTRSRVASCRTETSEQQSQFGSQFKAHKMPNFQIPFVVFKSNKPLTMFKEFNFHSIQPRERSTSSKTNNEVESLQQHHYSSQLRSKTPLESNSKSYVVNPPTVSQQQYSNQQINSAKAQVVQGNILQDKMNKHKDILQEKISNFLNPSCQNGYLQYWQQTQDSELQQENSCNFLEINSNHLNNQHPKLINQSNTSRNSRNNSKVDLVCKRQQNSKIQGQSIEKQNSNSTKDQSQKQYKTHKYSQKENIPLQQNDLKIVKQQQSCNQSNQLNSNNQKKCLSQFSGQVKPIGQIHCDQIKRIPQLVSQNSYESIFVPNEFAEYPCNKRRQFHFL